MGHAEKAIAALPAIRNRRRRSLVTGRNHRTTRFLTENVRDRGCRLCHFKSPKDRRAAAIWVDLPSSRRAAVNGRDEQMRLAAPEGGQDPLPRGVGRCRPKMGKSIWVSVSSLTSDRGSRRPMPSGEGVMDDYGGPLSARTSSYSPSREALETLRVVGSIC